MQTRTSSDPRTSSVRSQQSQGIASPLTSRASNQKPLVAKVEAGLAEDSEAVIGAEAALVVASEVAIEAVVVSEEVTEVVSAVVTEEEVAFELKGKYFYNKTCDDILF